MPINVRLTRSRAIKAQFGIPITRTRSSEIIPKREIFWLHGLLFFLSYCLCLFEKWSFSWNGSRWSMRRWCPRLLCSSPPSLSNQFTVALLPLLSRYVLPSSFSACFLPRLAEKIRVNLIPHPQRFLIPGNRALKRFFSAESEAFANLLGCSLHQWAYFLRRDLNSKDLSTESRNEFV